MPKKSRIGPDGKWLSKKYPYAAAFLNKQADIGEWMIKSRFAYYLMAGMFIIAVVLAYFLYRKN